MNAEEYRRAVDAVDFSPDFARRTLSLLEARRKETASMKRISLKPALIAAAMLVALAVTASAAFLLLSPSQVAQHVGNNALAAAFESGDAITVNDTQSVSDYQVTLMGLLPGQALDQVEDLSGQVESAKTYAVLAYARTDGTPITDDVPELTVSPLVEGYAPWQLNAWTLGGSTHTFAQDGTLYYLFECDSVEPFADHTVYLAVYPGTHIPPSAELFSFGPDGAIAYQSGQDGALFTLPLDASKADPILAAQAMEPWMQPQASQPPVDAEVSPDDVEFTWENAEDAQVVQNGVVLSPVA